MEVRLAARGLRRPSALSSTRTLAPLAKSAASRRQQLPAASSALFSTTRSLKVDDRLPPRPPPPPPAAPPPPRTEPSFPVPTWAQRKSAPSLPDRKPTTKPTSIRRLGAAANTPSWAQPRAKTPVQADLMQRFGLPPTGYPLGSLVPEAVQEGMEKVRSKQFVSDLMISSAAPGELGPPKRLVPQTGRSVDVSARLDVAAAFGRLQIMCRQNGVASDSLAQRFHERPGKKRKRLKSVRWRKRFKRGFQHTVQRVMELANQGW